MARLTKLSEKKIWVGFRQTPNDSLSVRGFEDVLVSENGIDFSVEETATARATSFLGKIKGAIVLEGAKTAERAIEIAKEKGV